MYAIFWWQNLRYKTFVNNYWPLKKYIECTNFTSRGIWISSTEHIPYSPYNSGYEFTQDFWRNVRLTSTEKQNNDTNNPTGSWIKRSTHWRKGWRMNDMPSMLKLTKWLIRLMNLEQRYCETWLLLWLPWLPRLLLPWY